MKGSRFSACINSGPAIASAWLQPRGWLSWILSLWLLVSTKWWVTICGQGGVLVTGCDGSLGYQTSFSADRQNEATTTLNMTCMKSCIGCDMMYLVLNFKLCTDHRDGDNTLDCLGVKAASDGQVFLMCVLSSLPPSSESFRRHAWHHRRSNGRIDETDLQKGGKISNA
jgi:hypothetical protein